MNTNTHERTNSAQGNDEDEIMMSGRLPLINPGPSKTQNKAQEVRSNQIAPLPESSKKDSGKNKGTQEESNNNTEINSKGKKEEPKKAVYQHKNKLLNITRMLTLVCSNYCFGYYLIIGGVLAPTLTELVYKLPEDERNQATGNFGFFFAVGCIVSNIFSGMLTKYVGRVRLVLVMEVCKIIHSLVYRVEDINVFFAMRFVSGILGGIGIGLIPLIINEMIPKDLTGYGGCLSFTWITIFLLAGALQSPIFGRKEGLEDHWQNVLAWPLVVSIICIVLTLLTMFGMETPNYYYEHYADKEDVLKEKVSVFAKRVYTEESAVQFTEDFIAEKKRIREASKGKKFGVKSLFGPKYRKQFALGCILNILQQMTGVNFMNFFATQLFDDISGNGAEMTIVMTLGNVVGATTSVFVINSGRKPGMLYPTIVVTLSLILMVFAISYENALLAGIGMFTYILSFALGFATIFSVYVVEILPPLGAGLAFSTQWVTAAVLGFLGAPMLDWVGIEVIVIIFIVCTIFSCLIMWLFCNETAGKTEEEIRNSFIGVKAE